MRIVGMMSGTSLDGVDAVLAEYHEGVDACWEILGSAETAIPSALKKTLYQLNFPNRADSELHTAKVAEQQLTHCYAETYHTLLQQTGCTTESIEAIAAHGQTIRHAPNDTFPYTLQLLNGALLSHLTQKTVICDFRSKDIAAGGQGAPLAPLFHRELFPVGQGCVVVNIGGISNISVFAQHAVSGFDCGPGNCLMDEWVMAHQGQAFDKNADWAKQGEVNLGLLDSLLSDGYFSRPIPKSTGRDYFHQAWLKKYVTNDVSPVDVMRTLVRLTAVTIADCVPDHCRQVILAGGGAKNPLLCEDIQSLLPEQTVSRSEKFGVDAQLVEGLGFAVLGRKTLLRQACDTRAVTGASYPHILGAVHFYA